MLIFLPYILFSGSAAAAAQEEEGDEAEEYQGPDFEPIIPLPDEVEVKTGEEEEKVLFVHRAKLFRFIEKQWKDRGVGDIKILYSDENGQARIVMRREQVLKVCANHYIKPDMTIQYRDEKDHHTLTWKAVDFAEGGAVLEQFCVRFKAEEKGVQFMDKFREAQKLLASKQSQKSSVAQKKEGKATDNLLDKFKPKVGSWECTGCYVSNGPDVMQCPACNTPKPGTKTPATPEATQKTSNITASPGGGFSFGTQASTSTVKSSSAFSFGTTTAAVQAASKSATVFSFGGMPTTASQPSTGGFLFGASQTTQTAQTPLTGFTFGGKQQPASATTSIFGSSKPTETKNDEAKPKGSGESLTGDIGAQFKAKAGSWNCEMCLVTNTPEIKMCLACSTLRPGHTPDPPVVPKIVSVSGQGGFTFGSPVSGGTTPTPAFGPVAVSSTTTAQGGFAFGDAQSTEVMTPATQSANMFGSANPAAAGGFMFGAASTLTTLLADPTSDVPKSTPSISPPKLSLPPKSSALSTTTPSRRFTGFGKPATQTTSATDLLKALVSKAKDKPDAGQTVTMTTRGEVKDDKKTVFGGFTFSAKPVISEEQKERNIKPAVHQHSPTKTSESDKEDFENKSKPNPFMGFSFVSPTMSTPAASISHTSAPMFAGGMEAVSFASIAKTGEKEAFAKKPDFKGFSGTGAQVFGQSAKSPGKGEEDGEADGGEDDYEPEVDFKPVVPLPDLVEVKTGEEQEEKLFNERAKLFRHDVETKEWKERGVGQMKILKHSETGIVRILMRREQVFKLCANHKLTKDMKLKPLITAEKAWCWSANDFSEGEMKLENFAVRFKTQGLADQFKAVFEVCQRGLSSEGTGAEAAKCPVKAVEKSSEGQKSLGQMFKPQSGDWECSACYLSNNSSLSKCVSCQTPKAGAEKSGGQTKSLGEMFKPKAGDWECQACYVMNKGDMKKCASCQTLKPGAQAEPEQSGDISSTTTTGSEMGGFSFGKQEGFTFNKGNSNSAEAEPSSNAGLNGGSQFSFGSTDPAPTSGSAFSFGAASSTTGGGFTFNTSTKDNTDSTKATDPQTQSKASAKPAASLSPLKYVFGQEGATFNFTPTKRINSADGARSPQTPQSPDREFYENREGEDSHIYFEPVVSLSKVDVRSGEEEEHVLYSHRAKLYRFMETEWKERGIGDVKILQHKESKKIRLLMRREQILKICLNHNVYPNLEMKAMANDQGKEWTWFAEDFSEGVGSAEKFAIKFKTTEIANVFKDAIEDAKQKTVGISTPDKERNEQTAKTEKPDSTTGDTSKKPVDSFSFKVDDDDSQPTSTSPAAAALKFTSPSGASPVTKSIFGGGSPASTTHSGFFFGITAIASTTSMFEESNLPAPKAHSGASPLSRGKSLLASLLEKPQGVAIV